MKNFSRITLIFGSALILASSGCAITEVHNVRSAQHLAKVDPMPNGAAKGYVEFYARSGKGVIPIYLIDDPHVRLRLAATGLHAGDDYSSIRHPMVVAEKLQVTLPAGTHTFMVQKDGQIIRVPVEEGKTTTVEIDYELVDQAPMVEVYKVNAKVLASNTAQ